MLLKVRFITGICYLGWLVTSTHGQDVKMTTFSRSFSSSSRPDGHSEVESMAVIRCAAKCLSVPSCEAWTYDEDDHLCVLHNTLREIDHYATARKPHAKYIQMLVDTGDEYLVSGVRYKVPDRAISASSVYNLDSCNPRNSRLNTQTAHGAWCAKRNDEHQWIAVNLGGKRRITGVTTRGRSPTGQWVASYTIAHGNDSSQIQMYRERTGQDKVFPGNVNNFGTVTNMLQFPFTARYVRIQPKTWQNHVSMRFDLVGSAA